MQAGLSAELVIPSYNRLDTLQNTLRHIRLLYPDIPICLGLQGDVPDQYQRQIDIDPKIRVLKMAVPGTAAVLNQCIVSSQADIILLLDDDAVPHFGWFESHMTAFNNDANLAYTGGREVRLSKARSSFSEWIRIIVEFLFGLFLAKDKKLNGRIVAWISWTGLIFGNFDQPGNCLINSPRGCNMALRRNAFISIGGFNEKFRGNAWGFESEFGIRAERRGMNGKFCGDAIVVHHEVPSGGSRVAEGGQWFGDYFFNHRLLVHALGPQAWIGSIPRLLKKRFFN